jgi:hypothetical protein
MPGINEALDLYRRQPSPPENIDTGFHLVSSIGRPAESEEIEEAKRSGVVVNDEAIELWSACREARLFEDIEYGQWGLVLLSPVESVLRTISPPDYYSEELRPDDLVLGEFLGDTELMVLAPSESGRRRVLIALPLDPRADWFGAAADLAELLIKFHQANGVKYWEEVYRNERRAAKAKADSAHLPRTEEPNQ